MLRTSSPPSMVRDCTTTEYNIAGDPDDPRSRKDLDEPSSHGGNSPPRGRCPGGGGLLRDRRPGGVLQGEVLQMIWMTAIQEKIMKMMSLRMISEETPLNIPKHMGLEPDATTWGDISQETCVTGCYARRSFADAEAKDYLEEELTESRNVSR